MTLRLRSGQAGKTILILGGGTGGLVAANRLRRMLSREHRVILVDRSRLYSFAPSYTRVMTGSLDGSRITRDLSSLSSKGIEFVIGEVRDIDPANKSVRVGDDELLYDYLVVALGAQYSSDEIPGLGRTWTYYHLDGAEGLSEKLPTFTSGRVAIVVSALPYKCPAAPYEGALLLDDYFRRRGLRSDVEIRVFTPETPLPMRAAGDAVGQRVAEMLTEREVGFVPGAKLQAVDHDASQIEFEDGSAAPFDLLIATPIHRAPDVLRDAGVCARGGWVPVDRETLATEFDDVYAIGDATTIPLGKGLALPKAGVFAHGEAEVVARNVVAKINGGQAIWAFGGQGGCYLSTGATKAAYIGGNFFADPEPEVELRGPSRRWHWTKLGFERAWLWRWF